MTTDPTTDLVTWLRVQLDDDERVARETAVDGGGQWRLARFTDRTTTVWDGEIQVLSSLDQNNIAEHITRWDPARVLAEVDAKRRILGEHYPVDPCDAHDAAFRTIACDTVRLLALPMADRDGYRDEWRP